MTKQYLLPCSFLCLAFFLASCDSDPTPNEVELPKPRFVAEDDYIVLDSGLKIYDFSEGIGDEEVKPGALVAVHYHGWLHSDSTLFDSSYPREEPIEFFVGDGVVIEGWDLGLPGMKVNGERQLVIPPHLAYGEEGRTNAIPPNSTLIFEIVLVEIVL